MRIALPTRVAIALGLACVTCGGANVRGRAVRLASRDVNTDRVLERAHERADDGDYEGAEAMLTAVFTTTPTDPLSAIARVRAARLRVARGDLEGATMLLRAVPDAFDASLSMRKALVVGLIAARRNDTAVGIASLRPLLGRMIDRSEALETDCALASLEARAGHDAVALQMLARVEAHVEAGVRWIPTGLACDRVEARADAMRAVLARVEEPRALADALDALPQGNAVRVEVARRLRSIAEARGEIPRWLRWLADLPDTEATLRVVRDTEGLPMLRVGVLAPTSGARALVGTEVLRAVQIALEDQRAVEILTEDEGNSAAEAAEAFTHLATHAPTAVIGPTLEAYGSAVSERAEAASIDLHLLSPHVDDLARLSPHVHAAGPGVGARAAALAAATRTRGTRVRFNVAPGAERGLFALRVRSLLGMAGVAIVDPPNFSPTEIHLVLGPWGLEARDTMQRHATSLHTRWVFDARSGPAGSPGVWVGLAAPDPNADRASYETLQRIHARFCELTGRAPSELALLAFDAARAVVERARDAPHVRVLPADWTVRAEVSAQGDGTLAVMRRCEAIVR